MQVTFQTPARTAEGKLIIPASTCEGIPEVNEEQQKPTEPKQQTDQE